MRKIGIALLLASLLLSGVAWAQTEPELPTPEVKIGDLADEALPNVMRKVLAHALKID